MDIDKNAEGGLEPLIAQEETKEEEKDDLAANWQYIVLFAIL